MNNTKKQRVLESSYTEALNLLLINCNEEQRETAQNALKQIQERLEYTGKFKYNKELNFVENIREQKSCPRVCKQRPPGKYRPYQPRGQSGQSTSQSKEDSEQTNLTNRTFKTPR